MRKKKSHFIIEIMRNKIKILGIIFNRKKINPKKQLKKIIKLFSNFKNT